jgi:hypothetical protein
VLAQPSPRTSRLELPAGFDRMFVVRVGVDQVLAELGPNAVARTLALRPGVYGLRAWRGKRLFTGEVTVVAGERRHIGAAELTEKSVAFSQPPGQPDGPWSTSSGTGPLSIAAQTLAATLPRPPAVPGSLGALPLTSACQYQCELEVRSGRTDCAGSVRRIEAEGARSVFAVSMASARLLELTVEVCDPTGYVLLVADSAGCDGGGGDNNETFYDAEVELRDTTLSAYPNDLAAKPAFAHTVPRFVPSSGCSRRTLYFADGWFYDGVQPAFPQSSQALLRINPPPAAEGVPDALWYVGVNRTVYRRDRDGAGVRSLRFCQKR